MAGEAAFFLLFVAFALLVPLGLYVLVRSEHERPTMSREDAERVARADSERRED